MTSFEYQSHPNPVQQNLAYFYDGDTFNVDRYVHYHRVLQQDLPALCEQTHQARYDEALIVSTINSLYGRWAKMQYIRALRSLRDRYAQQYIAQGRAGEILWPDFDKYFHWIDQACLTGSPMYLIPNLMRSREECLNAQATADAYRSMLSMVTAGTDPISLRQRFQEPEPPADSAAVDALSTADRAFYLYFHDLERFREYKHTFLDCHNNTDVARFIVRPMVVQKLIDKRTATTEDFIQALLGMVTYETGAHIKALRVTIHSYIDDL